MEIKESKKLRIWLSQDSVNKNVLREYFEIVKDISQADYYICWSSVPMSLIKDIEKRKKVIFIGYEPPLGGNVIDSYDNMDLFHSNFLYNPDKSKHNQFNISENPLYFPVNPYLEWDIIRKDTTIKNRGIYYCGEKCIGMYSNVPDKYGINMKDDRDKLALWLIDNYKESHIFGPGWKKQTKYNDDKTQFRLKKRQDIESCDADFNLVIENFLMPGLISERLHDGFNADRVMLYLGNPEIHKWIPKNCFIDLRPYFNTKTHIWDYNGLINRIKTITQEEYDNILYNARQFRKTMDLKENIFSQEWFATAISKRILGDNFIKKENILSVDNSDSYFVKNHFDRKDLDELLETIRPNFIKLDLEEDAKHHLRLIKIPTDAHKILEIGCGVGRLVRILKNQGKDIIGVDASEEMVKNSGILQSGLDIRYCVGDGNLDFENNTFDFIFSIIVFQHIPNINTIKKYIGESYRILNKGYFKFQVLNSDTKEEGCLLKNFHNKDILIETMKEVGFKEVKEEKIGDRWILISGKKE